MDAMKKAIINMWNKGWSGVRIAATTGKTRNAIMGIVFRERQRNPEKIRAVKPGNMKPLKIKPVTPPKEKIEKKSVSKVKIPLTFEAPKKDKNIRITDLTYATCRYPVSEINLVVDTFYCGHPRERGAYCAYHAQMCYVKMSEYKLKADQDDRPTRSRFAFGNT